MNTKLVYEQSTVGMQACKFSQAAVYLWSARRENRNDKGKILINAHDDTSILHCHFIIKYVSKIYHLEQQFLTFICSWLS